MSTRYFPLLAAKGLAGRQSSPTMWPEVGSIWQGLGRLPLRTGNQTLLLLLANLPLSTPITGSTHGPWTCPSAELDHPPLLPAPPPLSNPHPGWVVVVPRSPALALLQLHHLPQLTPAAAPPCPTTPPSKSRPPVHKMPPSLRPVCPHLCPWRVSARNTAAPLFFWLLQACLPDQAPPAPNPPQALWEDAPHLHPCHSASPRQGSSPTGLSGAVSLKAAKSRADALQQQAWGLAELAEEGE